MSLSDVFDKESLKDELLKRSKMPFIDIDPDSVRDKIIENFNDVINRFDINDRIIVEPLSFDTKPIVDYIKDKTTTLDIDNQEVLSNIIAHIKNNTIGFDFADIDIEDNMVSYIEDRIDSISFDSTQIVDDTIKFIRESISPFEINEESIRNNIQQHIDDSIVVPRIDNDKIQNDIYSYIKQSPSSIDLNNDELQTQIEQLLSDSIHGFLPKIEINDSELHDRLKIAIDGAIPEDQYDDAMISEILKKEFSNKIEIQNISLQDPLEQSFDSYIKTLPNKPFDQDTINENIINNVDDNASVLDHYQNLIDNWFQNQQNSLNSILTSFSQLRPELPDIDPSSIYDRIIEHYSNNMPNVEFDSDLVQQGILNQIRENISEISFDKYLLEHSILKIAKDAMGNIDLSINPIDIDIESLIAKNGILSLPIVDTTVLQEQLTQHLANEIGNIGIDTALLLDAIREEVSKSFAELSVDLDNKIVIDTSTTYTHVIDVSSLEKSVSNAINDGNRKIQAELNEFSKKISNMKPMSTDQSDKMTAIFDNFVSRLENAIYH